MYRLSLESKEFGKPDKEVTDKLKAMAEDLAWKKLQRITTTAALEALKGMSADGRLDNIQGLMQQVVNKAVSDFRT